MFDGSFKAKRTINLGGNKQQVDKQRLLRQAQEERRLREAERARQKAAENIQAWYRGRRVAANYRQELRASWDEEFQALQQLVQQSHSEPATASKTNIGQLVQALELAARKNKDESTSAWTLIDTLTLSETFKPLKDATHSSAITGRLLNSLYNADALMHIAKFVSRIPYGDNGKQSISIPLLLSIRICKSGDTTTQQSINMDQFISHILTVPVLPNRMPIEKLTTFTTRLPMDAILLHLSANSCAAVNSLPTPLIKYLTANIIAFSHQRVTKFGPAVSYAYLQVLTMLLGMIPQSQTNSIAKRFDQDDEDMEEYEWNARESIESSQKSPTTASATSDLEKRVLKWLSVAYDYTHLNDIIASLELSTPDSSTSSTHAPLISESIGAITQLFLNLITLFPAHKIGIMNNLMYFRFGKKRKLSTSGTDANTNSQGRFYGASIIKVFLETFTSTDLHAQLLRTSQKDSFISMQLLLDPSHSKAWALLAFISELYCQILVTMGDDEFHDETRNPISISNVVSLSSIVKEVSFVLWWNDNSLDIESTISGSKNLSVGYFRDILTKLTRQLHARDSRRPFCPKDHWLLSRPLDVNSFKRAVIQDEQRLSHDELDMADDEDPQMPSLSHASTRSFANRHKKSTQLARLSPRLGVLNNIPFIIRFEDRVSIFREFVNSDRQRSTDVSGSIFQPGTLGHAQIRRGSAFEDGYDQLNPLGPRLKGRISISFVDQYGIQEAGIDGGGVFKEFLTSLVLQAFDTNFGLFMSTSEQLLYPNPHQYARESTQLKLYEFLGRILGKALYEGILIDAAFAGFFLSKCLGQANYLDDLPSLDPELYRGLMFLKNYEGNVEDLSLYFTVDDEEMGSTVTRELVPGGSNIIVTRENRIRYIYLTAHYRLNTQIDRQCRAFFSGLSDLIDPKWLWMFNQQELQVMLGGTQTPISLSDLANNVVYSNFEPTDPTIEYFWSVVHEMNEEDRRLLIKFITSCARPPLLGFAELNPKLCIRNAGQEEERLPTSSTCMNLLKLPAFTSRQRLKEKLLYAIHSEAGFDLS
ncbi:hypothetical protein BGW38_002499 [Lunasporangiospora selenospora]|uniref:HECT-type E3 ubiquitin transferase n=1 Tax=Lunasporangiospora selenospora TaxID=979761 RepID=A0A9P6KCV1_9FUNG|nr:hypothetical protein BGW38_002499 [Lunasporangiospora selenospora]